MTAFLFATVYWQDVPYQGVLKSSKNNILDAQARFKADSIKTHFSKGGNRATAMLNDLPKIVCW